MSVFFLEGEEDQLKEIDDNHKVVSLEETGAKKEWNHKLGTKIVKNKCIGK